MSWIKWHGRAVEQRFRNSTTKATEKAIERAGMVADQQVPLDESTLQGSKTIKTDDKTGKVAIGYGGGPGSGKALVPYALRWHEEPANFRGSGRKHNYLRDPVRSELPRGMVFEFRKIGLK